MIILTARLDAQQIFYTHFNQDAGLSNSHIRAIAQDRYGYLWVGTDAALYRFNGSSFEEIEFSSNNDDRAVFDLKFDPFGTLWIAGKKGIVSYNGENFRSYGIQENGQGNFCHHLAIDSDGNVFFIYGSGDIYGLIKDKLSLLKQVKETGVEVNGIFADSSNNVYLIYSEGKSEQLLTRNKDNKIPRGKFFSGFLTGFRNHEDMTGT